MEYQRFIRIVPYINRIKLYGFYLALCLALSCNSQVDIPTSSATPITGELAISLILQPEKQRQAGLLASVAPPDDYEKIPTYVDSANFKIGDTLFHWMPADSFYADRDCWRIDYDAQNCGNYFSEGLDVQFGETYVLTIETSSQSISGKTTVPGDFSLSMLNNKLSWTASEHATAYHVYVADRWERLFEEITTLQEIDVDLSLDNPEEWKATVVALDTNYYNFITEQSLQAGITGGYGVFGSAVVRSIAVVLQ